MFEYILTSIKNMSKDFEKIVRDTALFAEESKYKVFLLQFMLKMPLLREKFKQKLYNYTQQDFE